MDSRVRFLVLAKKVLGWSHKRWENRNGSCILSSRPWRSVVLTRICMRFRLSIWRKIKKNAKQSKLLVYESNGKSMNQWCHVQKLAICWFEFISSEFQRLAWEYFLSDFLSIDFLAFEIRDGELLDFKEMDEIPLASFIK